MLSTQRAMFEGRRDLLNGLAIDKLPWEGWTRPTPVYSFTMTSADGETYELFMERLAKLVMGFALRRTFPTTGAGRVPDS